MFYKGLIVDNVDENNNQRVKVRVLSIHPMEGDSDYNLVTDEVLPWARPCAPITASNANDYGEFDVPDIGEWVWLFFEDEEKQRPVYFGIVITDVDVNSSYSQSNNKISKDRWGNVIYRDSGKVQIVQNNGNTIHMDGDGILIKTVDGNIINLDDKNKKLYLKDVNNNVIETTDEMISAKNENGDGVEIANKQIRNVIHDENPLDPSVNDIHVLGVKLIEWLAKHTHTTTYPGSPTTVAINDIPDLEDILYEKVLYKNGQPYVFDKEDEDAIFNRLGEESPVFAPWVDNEETSLNIVKRKETIEKFVADNYTGTLLETDEDYDKYEELMMKKSSVKYTTQFTDDIVVGGKSYPVIREYIPKDQFEKLNGLDNRLQTIVKEAYIRTDFWITSGYRSPAYQKTLYDRKLTPCDGTIRKSKHNYKPCLAVDLSPKPNGSRDIAACKRLDALLKEIASKIDVRLRWLGNVTMPSGKKDTVHWELK